VTKPLSSLLRNLPIVKSLPLLIARFICHRQRSQTSPSWATPRCMFSNLTYPNIISCIQGVVKLFFENTHYENVSLELPFMNCYSIFGKRILLIWLCNVSYI